MKSPVNLIKGDGIANGLESDYRDNLPTNMYAVKKEILGAKGYMIEYPGLTLLGTGSGIDRSGVYNERLGNQYRISGTKMVSVSTAGAVVELGTVPGESQARMEGFYSFNTQGVIADGKFFLYDTSAGFREVTDADLGSPIDGVWVDGYYFMTDGEYIFHTDIDDESAIDPLKFATAEFMPDPSNGLSKTQDNKVMVWGRYSLEYFVNDATSNFSFTRVQTRAQKIGIVATHAKCESGGNFFITGGYKDSAVGVYKIGIGTSIKVSTREIDKLIKEYSEPELSDMRMEARTEDDITFVLVHLPGETLCFNESVAKSFGVELAWTKLKSDVQGDVTYRAINGVNDSRSSEWVYGDKQGSNIGLLDNDVCTHYEEIAEWLLYTALLKIEKFSIDEIELETIPGHTTDSEAKISFSLTYDGVIYGNEWFELYGEPGNYNRRFYLRRLGIVSDWVAFKFRGATKSRMAFALMEMTYS